MEGEATGSRADQLLDHMAIEAHALALDLGARLAQEIPRIRQHEIHADLFEHLERGLVNRLDFVSRDDFHRRETPDRAAARQLGDCIGDTRLAVAAAPALAAQAPATGLAR